MEDRFLEACDKLYNKFKEDVQANDVPERRQLVQRLTVQLRRLVLDVEDLIPDLEDSHISQAKRRKHNDTEDAAPQDLLPVKKLIFDRTHNWFNDSTWKDICSFLQQDDVLRLLVTLKRMRQICIDQRMLRVYLHKRYAPLTLHRFLIVPDYILVELWLIPFTTIVFDGLTELRVKVLANVFPKANFIDLTGRVLTVFLNLERPTLNHLTIGIHQLHHLRGKPPCKQIHVNCYHRPVSKVFSTFANTHLNTLQLLCVREEDLGLGTGQVSVDKLIVYGPMNPAIAKSVIWEKVRALHFEYTTKCPLIAAYLNNLLALSISVNVPPTYLDLRLNLIPLLSVPFLTNLDSVNLRWLKLHVVWQPILEDVIPLVVRFPLLQVFDLECLSYSLPFWPDLIAHKCLVERRTHLPNCFVVDDDGKYLAKALFKLLHLLHKVTVGTDSFIRDNGRIVCQLE